MSEKDLREFLAIESEEFVFSSQTSDLPISEHPSYLKSGINGICTSGSAVFAVFGNVAKVCKNDIVIIFPHQLASISDVSDDFSITFFTVSYQMFLDIMSSICRLTPDLFFYKRKQFAYSYGNQETQDFLFYCHIIRRAYESQPTEFKRESLIHLLRVFYWEAYVNYKTYAKTNKHLKGTHKEELAFRFMSMVIDHFADSREVAFYAGKLCVSPKYLTMIVKEVSGKSAKECIIEYTLLQIKALLRDASLGIKDVVWKTKFSNQSIMSRFFRKHTGMSPSQYRESVHLLG